MQTFTKPLVLVIGATGNVGRAVVDQLAIAGVSVRAGSRTPSTSRVAAQVTPTRLDLLDPQTFAAALDGVSSVFLLAPTGHVRHDELLGPFIAAAVPRVEKIVTMTANGVQLDDSHTMRKLELLVARSGVAFVHLRPGWFMQNFNSFWLGMIKKTGVLRLPAGEAKTAFIDSRDIGAAAAAVLLTRRYDGQSFALTGAEAFTYHAAAGVLAEASGRPLRYEPADEQDFTAVLDEIGLSREYAALLLGGFAAVRAGFAETVEPALTELLGRRPTTLAEYATEHAAAWR